MIRALLVLFILLPAAVASAQEGPKEPLSIVTAGGQTHAFQVEIAGSPEEKARGLMYRKSLTPDAGMLFLYGKARRQSMWMKNTLIPLDMLFIARDGLIKHIHERAVPRSLDVISSRGRVTAVLELRGGSVAKLGIRKGDRVDHPAFK